VENNNSSEDKCNVKIIFDRSTLDFYVDPEYWNENIKTNLEKILGGEIEINIPEHIGQKRHLCG